MTIKNEVNMVELMVRALPKKGRGPGFNFQYLSVSRFHLTVVNIIFIDLYIAK